MSRTRVKICGLCSPADAAAAVAAGADAVGVVLAPSPRRVSLDEAFGVLADVPPFVWRVGVFVDADPSEVADAVARLGLHAVQFHGVEPPEDCAAAPVPVIKSFRVEPTFGAADIEPYRGKIAAALLDTFVPGAAGGTGKAFEWSAELAPAGIPTMVAGGLQPGNAALAVRAMRPFALDVSSGVERAQRCKDRDLMVAFVAAVREADKENQR